MENTFQNKTKRGRGRKRAKRGSIAVQAMRKVNKIAKELKTQVEVKTNRNTFVMTPVAGTSSQSLFGYPIQGTASAQRIGNDISIISLSMKCLINSPSQTSPNLTDMVPSSVRFIIGYAHEGYQDLIGNLVHRTLAQDAMLSSRNKIYTKEIKILYDNVHVINKPQLLFRSPDYVYGAQQQYIEMYKTFKKPLEVKFSGPGSDTSTVNQFFCIAVTSNVLGQSPTLTPEFSIRYTDQ